MATVIQRSMDCLQTHMQSAHHCGTLRNMTLTSWLTVVTLCALGAMSPGPSLVVILKQTLGQGRKSGMIAAVAHALGVGLYALACISGIGVLITGSPALFPALQWSGAAYLLWLGVNALRPKAPSAALPVSSSPRTGAARAGFLIAFLNPKVALFFIALFSQIIGSRTNWLEKLAYAATATLVDMSWYTMVAWLFSNPRWLDQLQHRWIWLERAFGVVLITLAVRLLVGSVSA